MCPSVCHWRLQDLQTTAGSGLATSKACPPHPSPQMNAHVGLCTSSLMMMMMMMMMMIYGAATMGAAGDQS